MRNQNVVYALLLVVAILVAVASLYLLVTSRPPGEGSAEAGFARDMTVHHAQAVEMAEIVRDRTESEEMRTLATDIALTQQAQIGQMQGWLDVWGLPATGTEPAMSWMGHPTEGRMPGMATPEEINHLEDAPPAEANRQFLYLMIRHHRGAIPMAEAVLERTDRPEVRQLAKAIAATQRQEIRLMDEMSRDRLIGFAEVPLVTIKSSGVSGTATFEEVDGGVRVDLEVEGLPKPGTTYLAHIHPGSCGGVENGGGHEHSDGGQHAEEGADHAEGHGSHRETGQPMGEIEAPLTPLEANAEGHGSSTTVVQNATVDGLFSGESEYVNVHAGGSGTPPYTGLCEPQPRRVADYTSRRGAMSHPHSHGHSHHNHGHPHGGGSQNRRALATALAITATYTVAEVIGGLITGSLALLADAGHMLSDNFSLGLALFAFWLSAKPPTPERSFGYKRAEILVVLVNGMTLVAISIWIFYEAYHRFQDPPEILGGWVMAVAVMGLFVNVAAAWVLMRSEVDSLNLQGALRHILADLAGSAGVIAAALIILLTGWLYADPLISVLIGFLVLGSSWKLLRDSVSILLEQSPPGMDAEEVGHRMVSVEGVEDVHDLHIWTITSGFPTLAAHVLVGTEEDCHERRRELEKIIYREFGIEHTTLQVDHVGDHAAEDKRIQFLPQITKREAR